jgi:hypothetical protein
LYRIGDDVKEVLESGCAVVVGTASAAGRPESMYAWGPRLQEDGSTLSVFIERQRIPVTLANARETGLVAIIVADPVSYRSVQLKGRFLRTGEASAEDEAWVQRHRESFATAVALIGDPERATRNYWMDDVVRFDVAVERAFDQTPGPGAGRAL